MISHVWDGEAWEWFAHLEGAVREQRAKPLASLAGIHHALDRDGLLLLLEVLVSTVESDVEVIVVLRGRLRAFGRSSSGKHARHV